MTTTNTHPLLFGRNKQSTKRWSLIAVLLLLFSLVFFAAIKRVDSAIHLFLWWEGYAVLLVALIAVQAYSNEGVIGSWMLAFTAVVGVILNYGGIGILGEGPGVLQLFGLAILGGLISAAIFGTFGFGLGVVARRIIS